MKKFDLRQEPSANRRVALCPRGEGRLYSSGEPMGESDEIRIAHEGAVYRLRRMANGKLILTR